MSSKNKFYVVVNVINRSVALSFKTTKIDFLYIVLICAYIVQILTARGILHQTHYHNY